MEYLQAESQFTIQSLREKLAAKEQEKARSIDEDRMDEDVPVAANEQLEQVTRDLAVQHDLVAKLQEECKALRAQLQADAEAYAQNLTDVMREKTELAESKDTEVKSLEDRILDLSDSLNSISAERDSLSTQSQKLQVDVQSLQHEIRDYELRLHSAQTSRSPAPSFNASQQALAKQVEDLEARVLRRNEQIGVLQHDIKRLETNLRLAEDRVGEMSSELEMANTEKTAMLDDCATAREEREAMRKAKDAIEIELDEMTKQLSEKSTEVCILQGSIKTLEDAAVQIDESRLDEIAVLVSIVADRQAQLRSVVAKLEVERRQHALTTEDSKSTLTDSAACESAMLEDVCMKSVGVEDPIIEQLETEKAKLLVSTIPSMERDALIELINASKLEELEVARFAMLHDVRLSLHEKRGGSKPSEADEEAELHRQSYLAVLRALGNEYSRMEGELEARAQKTEVQFDAVRTERSSLELQIETMKQEIAGLQSSLDGTSDEHQRAIDALVSDKSSLEQRLSALHGELESLKKTLEDEVEGRGSDRASFDAELKAVVEKNERLVDSEAALQRELEQHRTEAEDLHVKLEQIQAENSQIRTEMEELAGETQRANSKSQCLEQQLRSK
jgi:chromosome segregation ATPase